MLGIIELLLHYLARRGLLDDVLHKVVRVAYRAGHHAGGRVLILADYTGYPDLKAVVVERFQAELVVREVDICAALLVVLIQVGGVDVPEAHAAQLFIAPALRLRLDGFLRHERLHILRDAALGLQPQRIEHEVGYLVVAVDHQHYFVVLLRPVAVQHVVLLLQKRVDRLAVRAGQQLLPYIHRRIERAVGREERAVIATVDGAHGVLKQPHNVRFPDVAVRILCVEVHIYIIGILQGADILGYLAVAALDVLLEGLEVVRLDVGGDHGVHHVVHDGAGIDGVLRMLLLLRTGVHAHERGHKPRHVNGLGLYGYRVAGERILLHLVDIVLYAV